MHKLVYMVPTMNGYMYFCWLLFQTLLWNSVTTLPSFEPIALTNRFVLKTIFDWLWECAIYYAVNFIHTKDWGKKNSSQQTKSRKEKRVHLWQEWGCAKQGQTHFCWNEGRNWDHDLDFLFVFWMHDFSRSSFILP